MKIFCTLWLQNIGVSRGGKTTKIHALVNEHFQLIGIAIKLLSKVALAGKKVLADKAFCSEEIREYCFPSRFKFRLYQHALDLGGIQQIAPQISIKFLMTKSE